MPPLPGNVVGPAVDFPFSATIDLALQWHPRAQRLVIVTGSSDRDREWERRLRGEVARLEKRVTIEFLAGLPTTAVLDRLRELREDAVVFTPGYFQDGAGRNLTPFESASAMARVANAPMYGPFDAFMGTGFVGGYMLDFEALGRQAGGLVSELFAGAAPESLRLPEQTPIHPTADWRQVQRWGIDPRSIPADAALLFKPPTFLETNRKTVSIVAAGLLVQAGLIGWLLVERRRRRRVEMARDVQHSDLLHASRLALAGELTASLAHEINQPLGAIVSNVDAAEMILPSDSNHDSEVGAILTDIRSDAVRASEVIRRLRRLLTRREFERVPINFNEIFRDVQSITRSEAHRRRVTLDWRSVMDPVAVLGDRIQIQQVLLNLVINAMDAVTDLPEQRRTIVISVDRVARGILITVRDRGKGIAAADMPHLFDSFFSTKREGMGLGLSIARTIVEAHGGRIWAETGLSEGVVFHIELPPAAEADMASSRPA
jgi:signal transduction histidine kinase